MIAMTAQSVAAALLPDSAALAQALTPQDFKSEVRPIWCPGCGHYGVLAAVTKALADLGRPREQIAFVSGIGCSSRIPAYTSVYGFHGVHGRALPVAAGIKLARPDLTVLAAGGDGDGLSIGGNHFMHACRRNVDMTYIVMDNEVYGMTKGQASPTTAGDWCNGKLTPEGTGIPPVDPVRLALASGANFIARGFAGNLMQLAGMIVAGINHPGFSFIHVLSPCVTFRPEQREWRQVVHGSETGPAQQISDAMRALADDDGFTTGVLLAANRPAFVGPGKMVKTLADFERKFVS
jgi:2-oxoglutarate ferredoxin oxidoreductase subunit beta